MTMVILSVVEAAADQRTASTIAKRVLGESPQSPEWLSDSLEHMVDWFMAKEPDQPYLLWKRVKATAQSLNIKAHGHFGGQKAAADALTARKAMMVAQKLGAERGPIHAVLLIRDSDGDRSRKIGLNQARDDRAWPFEVVIGLADTKREVWVLNGFVPTTPEEETRLKALKTELNFNPCVDGPEFTAKGDKPDAPRNAKRAVTKLTGGDIERELACLNNTPLDTLRTRGKTTGLNDFIEEVEARLLPILLKG